MPPIVSKVVVGLLLLMQVWAGYARGQVVCVPLWTCDRHAQAEASLEASSRSGAAAGCGHNHDHGPIPLSRGGEREGGHDHEDCGCHAHLPAPDDQRPKLQPRGDSSDVRLILPPVVAAILNGPPPPERAISMVAARPDPGGSARTLALKSTRLLI